MLMENYKGHYIHYWKITIIVILLLITSTTGAVAATNGGETKKITPEHLKQIIAKHQEWLQDFDTIKKMESKKGQADPRKADLNGADLSGTDLRDANLYRANLTHANLTHANLSYANLSEANLTHANLSEANLTHANLFWANLALADLSEANLTHANLRYADLSVANLTYANLSESDMLGANLSDANLYFANLTRSSLPDANLKEANLREAKLIRADLFNANLTLADLRGTNLTRADLSYANLSKADLRGAYLRKSKLNRTNVSSADLSFADMSNADLSEANMGDAFLAYTVLTLTIFQPDTLPSADSIANADNLHKVTYTQNPQALIKLRKAFYEAGFREQERAITHALNYSAEWRDESLAGKIEGLFKYVFFNLPTQWGMYPGRALRILLIFLVMFSVPYIVVIRRTSKSGIYRNWNKSHLPSIEHGAWNKYRQNKQSKEKEIERLHCKGLYAVLLGIYFSLLSAFNIGFREINVGNWITRLQPRDYTFYATGWVRSVSGIQSLISVYLVAMWVLTYFGRPFG